MKGRDFVIGAAIGVWLVMVFHGQHGQVSPATVPVASAPAPSATSSPSASAPATPLPRGSPAVSAPQASPRNVGASPGPAISDGPGWFILVVFSAVIVISVSTVAVTALHVRAANGRRAS
jgi:hypothetical protein